jgi:3-dehydroquinate synthase
MRSVVTEVQRIPVVSAGGGYEIRLGAGRLRALPAMLETVSPAARYAVISDDVVAALLGRQVCSSLAAAGTRADLFAFPAGEQHKTRATWADLSDRMLAAGLGRDCAVVALGGGVVGDVAGFVAATYMRGVPVVQVPTTLLAMIDASIGGKTGVDTPAGKNLIGAFHPPRAVLIDPEVLSTLPAEHLRAGLAEAVKHGAIADAAYLTWIDGAGEALLRAEPAALTELIRRSVEIKARFVAEDEYERGPRKLLNFGHTVGHAVETLSDYRLLHGAAVAIGMVAEARIGERLGWTEPGTASALAAMLASLGLPTCAPAEYSPEAVVQATRTDKKARAGQVEYALIERLGAGLAREGRWAQPVPDEVVVEVVRGERGGTAF